MAVNYLALGANEITPGVHFNTLTNYGREKHCTVREGGVGTGCVRFAHIKKRMAVYLCRGVAG